MQEMDRVKFTQVSDTTLDGDEYVVLKKTA